VIDILLWGFTVLALMYSPAQATLLPAEWVTLRRSALIVLPLITLMVGWLAQYNIVMVLFHAGVQCFVLLFTLRTKHSTVNIPVLMQSERDSEK
jgi:hypothetical protein